MLINFNDILSAQGRINDIYQRLKIAPCRQKGSQQMVKKTQKGLKQLSLKKKLIRHPNQMDL